MLTLTVRFPFKSDQAYVSRSAMFGVQILTPTHRPLSSVGRAPDFVSGIVGSSPAVDILAVVVIGRALDF